LRGGILIAKRNEDKMKTAILAMSALVGTMCSAAELFNGKDL
jgi:hypothetical protein